MSTVNKLEALKNAFDKKAKGGGGDQSWKLFYPFWKMDDGAIATFRFLPDADPDNNLGFLVENLTHELTINGEKKKIPCLEMHGEECPICKLSRQYYDAKDETNGKKYYRKKSYIGQGIVVESPIEHDQEQLVKLIDFGPAVFKQIQSAFQSGDLEEAPYEFIGGYNFRIRKTKDGKYFSYTTSNFAPKQSNLEEDVIGEITSKNKLYNLSDWKGVDGHRGKNYMDYATVSALLVAEQTGAAYTDPNASAKESAPTSTPASVTTLAQTTGAIQQSAPTETASAPQETAAPATVATEAAPTDTQAKGMSVLEQLKARAASKA